ncbi:MAG: response regulator [Actinomycetota bacterium]|nr:response regulator [Actinomycetota bacterium]
MPTDPTVIATRTLGVLLVEDDAGDVLIAREALRAGNLSARLDVVTDGVEAIAYLHKTDQYADATRPDLILLDLNLPRMSGYEVLASVKADLSLRRIPVIVLSTSSAAEDVVKSYDLHANVYVTKPVDFNEFADVIKNIDAFFTTVAQLPPR